MPVKKEGLLDWDILRLYTHLSHFTVLEFDTCYSPLKEELCLGETQ